MSTTTTTTIDPSLCRKARALAEIRIREVAAYNDARQCRYPPRSPSPSHKPHLIPRPRTRSTTSPPRPVPLRLGPGQISPPLTRARDATEYFPTVDRRAKVAIPLAPRHFRKRADSLPSSSIAGSVQSTPARFESYPHDTLSMRSTPRDNGMSSAYRRAPLTPSSSRTRSTSMPPATAARVVLAMRKLERMHSESSARSVGDTQADRYRGGRHRARPGLDDIRWEGERFPRTRPKAVPISNAGSQMGSQRRNIPTLKSALPPCTALTGYLASYASAACDNCDGSGCYPKKPIRSLGKERMTRGAPMESFPLRAQPQMHMDYHGGFDDPPMEEDEFREGDDDYYCAYAG